MGYTENTKVGVFIETHCRIKVVVIGRLYSGEI